MNEITIDPFLWLQNSDVDGESADDNFGRALAMSSDGNVIAIGAYLNDGNGSDSGHVRVYRNINNVWTQTGSDVDGESADDRCGWAVALSSDGSVIAIGSPYNDGNGFRSGHVRIFKYMSGASTTIPTMYPSRISSNVPTTIPTMMPSGAASRAPSKIPSAAPSLFFSVAPSVQPSDLPTVLSSYDPTAMKTVRPSSSPTLGFSEHPSKDPSYMPSKQDTYAPSKIISVWPTVEPSTKSDRPSMLPTIFVSVSPTMFQTHLPSKNDSSSPTLLFSNDPSVVKSAPPSELPTRFPSLITSIAPSNVPSNAPSKQISLLPSVDPTLSPQSVPSNVPSSISSIEPTSIPSQMPHMKGSWVPSLKPSHKQISPSTGELLSPSYFPSTVPTLQPSIMQSVTTIVNSESFHDINNGNNSSLVEYIQQFDSDYFSFLNNDTLDLSDHPYGGGVGDNYSPFIVSEVKSSVIGKNEVRIYIFRSFVTQTISQSMK